MNQNLWWCIAALSPRARDELETQVVYHLHGQTIRFTVWVNGSQSWGLVNFVPESLMALKESVSKLSAPSGGFVASKHQRIDYFCKSNLWWFVMIDTQLAQVLFQWTGSFFRFVEDNLTIIGWLLIDSFTFLKQGNTVQR